MTGVQTCALPICYPGSYQKGIEITGLEHVSDTIPFHAGTRLDADGRLLTSGGRVIALTSYGENIPEALSRSYDAASHVNFSDSYFRRDIGQDLMK